FKSRESDLGFKDLLLRLEQHIVELMFETDRPPNDIANELEATMKLDPDNPELHRQVADHLMEIDRPHQALEHLESAEKQQGASAALLVRKGLALDMLERHADAITTLER